MRLSPTVIFLGFLPSRLLGADVLQHHLHSTRDGLYVEPAITRASAASIHRDANFHAALPGPVYAQPLYVKDGPGGAAAVIVATEQNVVLAINASDGSRLWTRNVGDPVRLNQLPCGDIDPLGITGTPVADAARRVVYLDAMTTPDGGTTKLHRIFALSLDDGTTLPGWPVDVDAAVPGFQSTYQNQRGSLLLTGGVLYVPYGGLAGDCGDYHGWVVAVPVDNPASVTAWATAAWAGGIWAPGGLATDGVSIFAATGNTGNTTTWMGGEAIVRLGPGATFSGDPADFFTPSNWLLLDQGDVDLGGSGPILVDLPGATPSQLVVALGKNGVAYLLDRGYLGGLGTGDGITGEGVQSVQVANGPIINAAAAYTTPSGTYVVFHVGGTGLGCPGASGDLVAFRIGAASPPTLAVAWCAANLGGGSPIVTTSDGTADPIVWSAGAEYSNQLHAYDGETGDLLFAGGGPGEQMDSVQHFQVPIVADGRIFVAGNRELYAFSFVP